MAELNFTDLNKYSSEVNASDFSSETFSGTEREDVSNKSYDSGLPKTVRYPNTGLDDKMDFLVLRIAEFEPSGVNLSNLIPVQNTTNENTGEESFAVDTENITGNLALKTATESNRNNLKKPKHTIYLPIPRQIQDSNSVQFGDGKLNPLEALGAGVIQAGLRNPNFESIKKGISSLISIATDSATNNSEAIAAAVSGRAIGALGGNIRPNDLIARASGQILQPNLELLFQGVQLRQFPFQFEFFPRNIDEAVNVKNIIRILKKSMAAKAQNDKGRGIFIKQPDIFQLEYKKGGGEHPFLNKFLPMHLTDMKINYSASGTYSTFYDGTPTHMIVQCSFTEVNPVYKEDYANAGKGVGY